MAKRLHLPSVTGQILVGLLIGPAGLALLGPHDGEGLRAVIDFALGLMAVAAGSHLSLRRLANAKRRLLLLVGLEALITPVLVFAVLRGPGGVAWPGALLLATICVSTAPATILALVKEARARGVFTKTLLAGVALNNLACITLFEVARTLARVELGTEGHATGAQLALQPLRQLGLSALLGGGAGLVLVALTRRVYQVERTTTLSLLAILLVAGVSAELGLSTLLAGLFLGMALANLTPSKEEIGHAAFANFEYAIYAIFFTVAGMELSPRAALAGGLIALSVFVARLVGKVSAAWLAMTWAGATRTLRRYLGLALVPQAGLAVGLMLLVTEDPALESLHSLVLAVVLTVVLLNEILGPVLARRALARSGESGHDRPRVLDFLGEENILTGLHATSMQGAIERLADHLCKTSRAPIDRAVLVRTALEREAEQSTCMGEGLAVPHARLATGGTILGVMGISREGIRVPTPDGEPLRCIVLLATPPDQANRHLQVLAALAHSVRANTDVGATLFEAKSPAHAYGILHADDQAESFNQFLDRDDDEPRGARRPAT